MSKEFDEWWGEQTTYTGYEDSYGAIREMAEAAFEAGVNSVKTETMAGSDYEKQCLRDQFAMAVVAQYSTVGVEINAKWAYRVADAMLKERENK